MTQYTALNEAGLRILEASEGLRLKAYRDVAGVLSIGYGHTGPDVRPDSFISEDTAQDLLKDDLQEAKDAVNSLVRVGLTANQFSALVCFVYNVGQGAFKTSTLLRLLNQGDFAGAAEQFMRWTKAGGEEQPGLVARRKAEKALFES